MTFRNIAIVGAGPAGLMAAEKLADLAQASDRSGSVLITVYDRMSSVGRKFLLAGRGGLNLTHSEDLAAFMSRYKGSQAKLEAALTHFPPAALRAWSEELGEPTFVGSSGRVFPKSFKASPLLRAWLRRLTGKGVQFALRHQFDDVSQRPDAQRSQVSLSFITPDGPRSIAADGVIFALGGASWPRLGSTGDWVSVFISAGIDVAPLKPSNCGFELAWSAIFRDRFAGHPLKGASFHVADQEIRGEAMVTAAGMEGGAIYALSSSLRDVIAAEGSARLVLDLKPDVSAQQLADRLAKHRTGDSLTSQLRKLGLSPVAIGLMREAHGRDLPSKPEALAAAIKQVTLRLDAPMPIARAISSAGGVRFDELTPDFMLAQHPGLFVCGEMLDWEAPTGGYLLQACFATGVAAAKGLDDYLTKLNG